MFSFQCVLLVDSNCIDVVVCFCMSFFILCFPCIDDCDVISVSENYNCPLT